MENVVVNTGHGTILITRQDQNTGKWHTVEIDEDEARSLAAAIADALTRRQPAETPAKVHKKHRLL